ncbi:hypothetical protein PIB30_090971, partial [Stylosanthes scabra]|nr:hypothetical protein [Stylosanthes scabra]
HERQPEKLDLNTAANDAIGIGNTNADSGGLQNGHPQPQNPNSGSRPSAFDRLSSSGPISRPFRDIGWDESQIAQELRHRM